MNRRVILIIICFFSLTASSQTWNELKDSIIYYYDKGEHETAIHFAEKAVSTTKKLGEDHPDYLSSLNVLIIIYYNTGRYLSALPYSKQQVEIIKKIKGENHPDYAASLNNLGELCRTVGDYKRAEEYHKQVIEINKKAFGEEHLNYAYSLHNLATVYIESGRFGEAEPLLKKALTIKKNVLGLNHPDYAASLNNLAQLYSNLGSYELAINLYKNVLEIQKKLEGENGRNYITTLNNIAVACENSGHQQEAENLYKQTLDLREKTFGEEHPDYINSLNNLAAHYQKLGDYNLALDYYQKALPGMQKLYGANHPEYANFLNNLGSLSKQLENLSFAESCYKKALEIDRSVFGERSPDYIGVLNNLARLNCDMDKLDEAGNQLATAGDVTLSELTENFFILSETEKLKWLKTKSGDFNSELSVLFHQNHPLPSFLQQTFRQQLELKGLVLNDGIKMLKAVRKTSDPELQKLLSDWENSKSVLIKQYSLPVKNRIQELGSLEQSVNEMEKQINQRSSAFRKNKQGFKLSVSQFKKSLGNDEAIIEFVSFHFYNKHWTDSVIYAAFILRSQDSVPQFVSICEEKQLQPFFSKTGSASDIIRSIYRSEPADEEDNKVSLADSLYSIVWKPLLPYLNGITKINYSPVGLLNRIAFHALPVSDSILLIDKYELNRYISTSQLGLEQEEEKKTKKSITLFGDCSFSMDSTSMVKNVVGSSIVSNIYSSEVSRSGSKGGWVQLPGTAKEISEIKKLFAQNKIDTASFTQQNATEEGFKSLSGRSPAILHLATHGFFLPDPEQKRSEGLSLDDRNAFTLADNPMLRSGIVLSGANRAWEGKAPIEGCEDGIVTAYEISQLDLSNTQLVVLSACETALGDIKGTEGVFGLQRAFKLAGVKNMLLSLWKIPDAETAELMSLFYGHYLKGLTARESLYQAQREMRKKYSPFYWAAFVVIE